MPALTEVPLGAGAERVCPTPSRRTRSAISHCRFRARRRATVPARARDLRHFTWRGSLAQKRLGTFASSSRICVTTPPAAGASSAGEPRCAEKHGRSAAPERAWHVDELRLFDGNVHLADLGLGMPPIDFGLNTAFQDLALSLDGDAARHELQTIELYHIALHSPLDPFLSVLNLPTLFIRFTPAGLWRREIEQVDIIRPMLNVGPRSVLVHRPRAGTRGGRRATRPTRRRQRTTRRVDDQSFRRHPGQLVLAFEGHPKLPLPMPFESHAENLNFASSASCG